MNRYKDRFIAYLSLTKPRIIELLLITTLPTFFLARRGFPTFWEGFFVLLAGALSAAGANVFNCYFDRDIDAKMERTKHRPLVNGQISTRSALIFGWSLALCSFFLFLFVFGLFAAILSALAIFLYSVVYTTILKRRTNQNIVWGGVAGCMPVLIAWVAATGTIGIEAIILFLLIFFWTPAHYWPFSVRFSADYKNANIPMLSVTHDNASVGFQSIIYVWATIICSFLLVPLGNMGMIYTLTSIVAAVIFILEAHFLYAKTITKPHKAKPMRVFHVSITYLTLLFVAIAVDSVVRVPF